MIRLFEIEKYGLSDQVEILESLEYGSIILWRALWKRMRLSKVITDSVHRKETRISIEVSKYVEMMVINRCVNPLSKLATSRWRKTTGYSVMKNYADLPEEVEYFYRSMDYVLKAKDAIEKAVFKQLQNLFSINEQVDYIMGVKHRQNEMAPMILEDPKLFTANVIEQKGLKIGERKFSMKEFLIWKTVKLLNLSPILRDTKVWKKFEMFIGKMDPKQDLIHTRLEIFSKGSNVKTIHLIPRSFHY